jgi:hypothetical protein
LGCRKNEQESWGFYGKADITLIKGFTYGKFLNPFKDEKL